MKWSYLVRDGVEQKQEKDVPLMLPSTPPPHLLHNYSFATVGIYCASPVNYKLILSLAGWLFPLETPSCPPRFTEWLWRPISQGGREVEWRRRIRSWRLSVAGTSSRHVGMRWAYLGHRLYYSLNYSITTTTIVPVLLPFSSCQDILFHFVSSRDLGRSTSPSRFPL